MPSLTTKLLTYGPDDEFSGYLAYPARAKLPLPGVLVIQEAWGLDGHIEDVARRIAIAGYAALAPDLYARHGTRPEALSSDRAEALKALFNELPRGKILDPDAREAALSKKAPDEAEQLRESLQALFERISSDENLDPVLQAARFLRARLDVTRGQKIASVGFCMGGALSARLAAADPELAGAAIFYGMSPPEDLAKTIRCPIIGFYGALDQRINAGLPAFASALQSAGTPFDRHMYEGAEHAFFNDTRPSYDVRASRDAFARLVAFFRDRLV